jgi:hypothetical protein
VRSFALALMSGNMLAAQHIMRQAQHAALPRRAFLRLVRAADRSAPVGEAWQRQRDRREKTMTSVRIAVASLRRNCNDRGRRRSGPASRPRPRRTSRDVRLCLVGVLA